MKRILITGGAGFIGSNLTKQLLKDDGYHITCIDNFDTFYSRSIKEDNIKSFIDHDNYNFIEGDIRDNSALNKIWDVDIILHFAGSAI